MKLKGCAETAHEDLQQIEPRTSGITGPFIEALQGCVETSVKALRAPEQCSHGAAPVKPASSKGQSEGQASRIENRAPRIINEGELIQCG